jgi:hypothetical protein
MKFDSIFGYLGKTICTMKNMKNMNKINVLSDRTLHVPLNNFMVKKQMLFVLS